MRGKERTRAVPDIRQSDLMGDTNFTDRDMCCLKKMLHLCLKTTSYNLPIIKKASKCEHG